MAKKALVVNTNNNLFSINGLSIDLYPEFSSSTIYIYSFLNMSLRILMGINWQSFKRVVIT